MVLVVDWIDRQRCAWCGVNRRAHLKHADHTWIPNNTTSYEVGASELRPGDTIASIIPQQRIGDNPRFWVFRGR